MSRWNPSTACSAARLLVRALAAVTSACLVDGVGLAATLPTAPKTFDTTYAAPTGATLTVGTGGDLQAALDKAQPGDTIVLQAGATFTGPFKLPNKTAGSGWIYVVSSNLSQLPPAGTRVSPANASNMPKILARNGLSAFNTVANSHHFRFVGIEFAPAPGTTLIYNVVVVGQGDASSATLAHHLTFDRCYVHGTPGEDVRRGIEMDGAYVAVVDSYISEIHQGGADSQALAAWNTTGPIKIVNNYLEGATENVMFGGADAATPALVPADIEIRNNYFFKPPSLAQAHYPIKNLLEFKDAKRVLVTGNTFQNSLGGFAILVTPRNQNGNTAWSVDNDIDISGNTLINVSGGFNILGRDSLAGPSLPTERILIRNNLVGVTGVRVFQILNGGSDYTIDHNTIIQTAPAGSNSALIMSEVDPPHTKTNNFVFTNNIATPSTYGIEASGVGQWTAALNGDFSNWTLSKNVLVGMPAARLPAGNFYPADVASIGFVNYAGGNYALAAGSPYKHAGTDGADIGASGAPATNAIVPNPPTNVVVK